tara:strand:- start:2906 stop:4003 length:1098 start_codon:yes stop_codon:yes gene_type:complete
MKRVKNNLLVAASGTGGHIFPALSVIETLDDNWQINWLGIKKRVEKQIVPVKYNLITLDINSPSKKNLYLIYQYFKILLATFKILQIIKEREISLVFTTGGYISAPTILAAKILNIPVILHESNLVPGLVTRFFGRYCNYLLTGFKETDAYLKKCKITFTGTPLRDQFYCKNEIPSWVPEGDGPLICIMGGSQGAQDINELVFGCLDFLLENNFRIIHIVGPNKSKDLRNLKSTNYLQINFTNQIAELLQNCDLVISRSGSGAINEIIHTKIPSILIPYPNSKYNHQEKNAQILASIGASILINQKSNSTNTLKRTLQRIFLNNDVEEKRTNELLNLMKLNISELRTKDARYEISKIINSYRKDL